MCIFLIILSLLDSCYTKYIFQMPKGVGKDLFYAVETCALGSWHQAPTSHITQAGES